MTIRSATVAATVVAVGLVALVDVTLAVGFRDDHPVLIATLVACCWLLFAVSVLLLRRMPVDRAVRLLLATGVALQVTAVCWPPRTSTDVFRYAWDGRVGNHGIDPYAYPPIASQLNRLRVPWLFPPGGGTYINRPDVPTIYPPISQLWFRLVDAVTPDSWGIRSYQVAAALVAVAGAYLLVRVLRAVGRDPRLAALWAWCPLVVFESGNNAHVDGLGAVLTVAALALMVGRRSFLGGIVLGAAIGVKLIPGLILPALIRRRPVALLSGAVGLLALSYLPHVLSVGGSVIGYLPGYLGEEGYDDGERFALLRLVLPQSWAPYAAVIVGGSAALWVFLRSDPVDPWVGATTMVGVALLVSTPSYPWYALLLVALATMAGRSEWLVLAAAGYVSYLGGWTGWDGGQLRQVADGIALLVILAVWLRRRSGVGQAVADHGPQEDAGDRLALGVAPGVEVGCALTLRTEPDPAGA